LFIVFIRKIMAKKATKKGITISVIIPAKNEAENIQECINAVLSQGFEDLEIIVIDSGSSDETQSIVRSFPSVKLVEIDPKDFGHGRTRNQGAQIARGEYIAFLNGDALPVDSNWLSALIKEFEAEKDAAGVYSRHIPKKNCYLYMVRDLKTSMSEKRIKKDKSQVFDYTLFSTVSALIKREVLLKYPFHNRIIIAEDQDWAKRIMEAGYHIIYSPQSIVIHSHNYSIDHLYKVKVMVAQSFNKFNNRLSAMILGLGLAIAGYFYKVSGDLIFICRQKISLKRKLKEIAISVSHRFASFCGRYMGWVKSR